MSQAPASPWLSVVEAAKYLKCSKCFLDQDRQGKKPLVPYSRLGRRVLYNTAVLDAYLESTSSASR